MGPVNLGAVVRYANASQRARPRKARSIRSESESEYDPRTDYWGPVRRAIRRDRRTTRDGAALSIAAEAASFKRAPNYEAVARAWPDICERWDGAAVSPPSGYVDVAGLAVRIAPLFAETRANGDVEVPIVWLNKGEPNAFAVQVALHILQRALDDGQVPVFVDVQRGRVHELDPTVSEALVDGVAAQLRRQAEEDAAA